MPASVLIVNLAVLGAVLWADLGTKEITWGRVLRPLIVAVVAVAIFVKSPQTSGRGLTLELVGLAVGLALGALGSLLLMAIRRAPTTKKLISTTRSWVRRVLDHRDRRATDVHLRGDYNHALGTWLSTNRITVDGLTDGLILLAIGMVLARVVRFANVLRTQPETETDAATKTVRIA